LKLSDIVRRAAPPAPWEEGEKIPWDDPAFSGRMLHEHLSQAHDGASRRTQHIDAHVRWIHEHLLGGRPTRVLDLGCGPGLYTARLAALGHKCAGIDFSPASIAYATATVGEARLRCDYQLSDIRTAEYGSGFGLVMLIFGEINVFRPADARTILAKARHALVDGGLLLLEAHTEAAVRGRGSTPRSWQRAEHGLFSDRPHLRLDESFWSEEQRAATRRYLVIDAETADVGWYAESVQAYTPDEYASLLTECGFAQRGVYPSWPGSCGADDFVVLTGVAK
jgi:SAM-dependent methyltransferase